jgi:hypothetical protein
MPREKSIPKRLSGSEALDSLMHEVYRRLCAHGHFHSHKAYHGYSATVTVSFRPAMSYAPPLTDEFHVRDIEDPEAELGPGLEVTVEIPVRPPNRVRQENDMAMPVEVEENGQVIGKMIPAAKYRGKQKPGSALPLTGNLSVPVAPGRLEMPDGAVEQYGIQQRPGAR